MAVSETTIGLRVSQDDKAMLRELADRLQRNQSETVRMLVRGALDVIREQDQRNLSTVNTARGRSRRDG